ncbi:MAG: amidohydrolase [Omnitrophica WOR_2 bacterium]|jgi:predicted amidohydrolase
MNPQPINITIVQAPLVWADKQANLKHFTSVLAKLGHSTDLVVLPEMFATGFVTLPEEVNENMDGLVMNWMKDSAAKLNSVITGSIAINENGSYYNRLIWMRPDGSYEQYDKRHLFRMGNEHLHFSQGKKQLVVELKGWKIKPLVCYDLRFPVWSKNRLLNDVYEYDLLVYVANWPARRSFVWETLLAARAMENQVYCVGVNRIGKDGRGIPHKGGSVILDYKGKLITGCADDEAETLTRTLDYGALESYRESFKVALDWDTFEINA